LLYIVAPPGETPERKGEVRKDDKGADDQCNNRKLSQANFYLLSGNGLARLKEAFASRQARGPGTRPNKAHPEATRNREPRLKEVREMITVTIRQKDCHTHTIFMVYPTGEALPEDNYKLATKWMGEGLLNELSQGLMATIEAIRECEKEVKKNGGRK